MSAEAQTYFNVAIMIFGGLGGWILNSLRDSLRSLQQSDEQLATKLQAIELLVAGSYVKREDLDKIIDKLGAAIFDKLDKIDSKLDAKADKSTCSALHRETT